MISGSNFLFFPEIQNCIDFNTELMYKYLNLLRVCWYRIRMKKETQGRKIMVHYGVIMLLLKNIIPCSILYSTSLGVQFFILQGTIFFNISTVTSL